jgi:hypothetical protein
VLAFGHTLRIARQMRVVIGVLAGGVQLVKRDAAFIAAEQLIPSCN